MTTETLILLLSAVLGIVQLLMATQAATMQRGVKWNLSPRDEKKPDLTGTAGRLDRAFKNFMETYPFFIAGITAVHFANRMGPLSTLGAEIYLIARVFYIPLYIFGVVGVRSLVWLISIVGIAMVLFAALVS